MLKISLLRVTSEDMEKQILGDPSVHYLTKNIIKLCKGKDPIDVEADVRLALAIVYGRTDRVLSRMGETR